jgi:hypothetical protein
MQPFIYLVITNLDCTFNVLFFRVYMMSNTHHKKFLLMKQTLFVVIHLSFVTVHLKSNVWQLSNLYILVGTMCVKHRCVKKYQNVKIRDPLVRHCSICRDQRSIG